MKNLNRAFVIALLFLTTTGCLKNLDLSPQGQLTTANPLGSVPELQKYMNQFYEGTFDGQPGGLAGGGIAYDDQNSDNQVVATPPALINGTRALSGAAALSEYTKLRGVNFVFENIGNCKGTQADIDHYLGEAYFFRAYYYFSMLRKYGGVTWINKVLPPDNEVMKQPRATRTVIADSILADLDRAAALLKIQTNNATMRIHKDYALAFKSRVALFEGTWEKYHKAKGTPFFTTGISDAKITNYFEQARDAAKAVISAGRWSIFNTGQPLSDYQTMFITLDLTANKEVLFYKKYDITATPPVGHSITRYLNMGGGSIGLSLSLVDDYLTRSGNIFTGTARADAQKTYGAELDPALRDPRLSQTVARPGARLRPLTAANIYMPPFSPIITQVTPAVSWANPSGYSMLKYVEIDGAPSTIEGESKSQAPAIQMRYAEVLLNYAEALAELQGASAQQEITTVLQPLRTRAGMPAVDFQREYNTDPAYAFSGLSATMQVVRRERRIEFAAEGMRMYDIFRWAVADELLAGKRPLGPLFIGSNMVAANVAGGYYKGNLVYDKTSGNNLYLTGNPGDAIRYIDPYKNVCPDGLGFKTDRDYLSPINQDQLSLTGGKWVQNPGW
ncbi:RagB/SusD family nutrient uptake outer membrane protein [Niabella hirudinis]|uniref:RagB/SusD family nutrient uptake outer membrane protein n=1 Tax=Niabella hirudinis TaxID=1285929 RepID=UPI003EC09DCA